MTSFEPDSFGKIPAAAEPRFVEVAVDNSIECDWQELGERVQMRIKAHAECRSINSRCDRILRTTALVASACTAGLLMSTSTSDDDDGRAQRAPGQLFIWEITLTSLTAITTGLINLFNNAAQVQRHQEVIDRYTRLKSKLDIARRDPTTSHSRNRWSELRSRYANIQMSGVSVFDHVRDKYKINN